MSLQIPSTDDHHKGKSLKWAWATTVLLTFCPAGPHTKTQSYIAFNIYNDLLIALYMSSSRLVATLYSKVSSSHDPHIQIIHRHRTSKVQRNCKHVFKITADDYIILRKIERGYIQYMSWYRFQDRESRLQLNNLV